MMGGGEIIGSFLGQREIDEFRIRVIPILVAQPSGCAIFDRLNEALV